MRRLRPVTAAFAILAAMVLRPGYLPVPLVIGMLPFASLLAAGVADAAWGRSTRRTLAAADVASRRSHLPRALGPVLVAACLAAAAVVVIPQWSQRDRDLMTVDHAGRSGKPKLGSPPTRPPGPPAGRRRPLGRPGRARLPARPGVWFYKLDTERDVTGRYRRGWRDFDYLVSTATLRSFPDSLPQVAETQRHSQVVATFGRGTQRVEIRKVQGSAV
jgi:hypothetical protein